MTKGYPSSLFPPEASFFLNDAAFDWLYPEHLQLISLKHWTPVRVAQAAADYLAVPGAKVLDIGSGIGKFCLAAAQRHPDSDYYGIEQRGELVHFAERTRDYLGLRNAGFLEANITQVNFEAFDHFYFYNAFYENIDRENAIDDEIEVSRSLYEYYTAFLYHSFRQRPSGTRIVTYQSDGNVIPPGYRLTDSSFDQSLQLWIKA